MKEFRRKLAVILLETELNTLKGSPIYYEPDNEENVSDSDVEFLGDRKRKRQDSPDRAKDKSPLPNPIIAAADPHDLVDELCNHIMSINDADSLEKEWVRSSKPHPIGLSLRRIQGILHKDQPLDSDCFNMAIRILARDKALLPVDPRVRFMDLQFCTSVIEAALTSARDLDSRVQPDIQALASLLRSSTEIDNISSCNWILLPHAFLGHYILFAIDKHSRQVTILDPIFPPLSPERYALKFQRVSFYLNDALELAQPGWKSDTFAWPRKSLLDVPMSLDRNESGYFVFNYMLWHGNKFVRPIYTDGYELRKNILIHLLEYDANEAEDNIPYDVREILKCLK